MTFSANVWFFFHWIWSPITVFAAPDMRLIQMNYTKALLPTVALMTILSAAAMLIYPSLAVDFAEPIQRFAPFLPMLLNLSHRLFASFFTDTTPFDRMYNVNADLPWIRSALCVTSIALMAIFNYLSPTLTARFPLKFNHLLSFETMRQDLGGVIWLVLLFRDLKRARIIETSWMLLVGCYLVSVSVAGPGATLLVAWVWRENTLAARRN